jgi:hypothetical protein
VNSNVWWERAMVIFDPPIYIKQPDEDADVLVFGKSPKLKIEDAENGIARFGGPLRSPSYLHAYFRSADILVNEGVRTNCLDDVGLPIFYIQRHTIELLLKRLLSWMYEIAEFKAELGIETFGVPTGKQKWRFERSHKLDGLLRDLENASKKLGIEAPPDELRKIVEYLVKIEKSDTWSRYEKSKTEDGNILKHMESEVTLQVVDLQERLKNIMILIMYKLGNEEVYEYPLYEEWLSLARATGRAG